MGYTMTLLLQILHSLATNRDHFRGHTNINRRCLGKRSDRMNMVIENDDAHHHSQTEHDRLLRREFAPVLPVAIRQNKK